MACRLNLASRSFEKAAENLGRAAQVHLSGELLRQVVESEGKAVQAAKAGQLPPDWAAGDCPALDKDGQPTGRSRVYLGSDGVMVPHITDQEKRTRRERIKAKRRRCGKKRRALRRAKVGADGPFKEFKIVTLYDDAAKHRLVSVTRGDCQQAGRLMRRDAGRVGLRYVTDRREMIRYPEFQEQGQQIGSGPTESMCKATTQRIKGRGMRWDGDNAESVMALEALEQSGGWEGYWEAQLFLPA